MDDYEKITLSKQDLRYIYGQILNRTTSKLDLHLPSLRSDPLKNKVANVLDEFLLGTFDLAKSSLVIDGQEMAYDDNDNDIKDLLTLKPREKVEPFDLATNSKLRDILLQVEEETTSLTRLRRELPVRVKDAYQKLVTKTDSEVSTLLAELDAQTDQTEPDINIPNMDETAADYEKHILILNDLNKTIPARKAELDRYDETILFLEVAYQQQEKEH